MDSLPNGIYDQIIDEDLGDYLARMPELRSILGKIEPEEEPFRYARFLRRVIEKALRIEADPNVRRNICNAIIEKIAGPQDRQFLERHRLSATGNPVLLEITPPDQGTSGIPRPVTSLLESSLFTGSPQDPQLVHELTQEMLSANRVDVLVSFIKFSGLRLLLPGFEDLARRGVRLRLITTSYMGASDPEAIERLGSFPNAEIRVSYDTERTRLHAKAYHFHRESRFSTAYIGSANMSHAAMTSGVEWNLKVTAQEMPHIDQVVIRSIPTHIGRSSSAAPSPFVEHPVLLSLIW